MASDHFADRFVVRFRWGRSRRSPAPSTRSGPSPRCWDCCSSSRARSASSRLSWLRTSTAPISSAVTVLRRSDSAGPPPAGQVRPLDAVSAAGLPSLAGPRPAEGPRRRGRGGPRPHGRQAQRRGRAHTGDEPSQCPDRDRTRCVAVAGPCPRGFPPITCACPRSLHWRLPTANQVVLRHQVPYLSPPGTLDSEDGQVCILRAPSSNREMP